MSVLYEIGEIIEKARADVAATEGAALVLTETAGGERGVNRFAEMDNIRYLKALVEDGSLLGKIQMIYLDPPFFTRSDFDAVVKAGGRTIRHTAYDDKWESGMHEYLRQMAARLLLMRDLMSDSGLIFLHLDWHSVHYMKIVMDEIFGEQHFVNEIIWTYKSGGSTKKHFARKHDTILVYSKTGKYKFHPMQEKSYNRGLKPYHFKGVKEYKDEIGWYTMVNMKDVWAIDMVGRTSQERTGYASQKPEQLIERLVRCSTEEGDLCADFFCGSGTLPAVAARLGRRFVACDIGHLAAAYTIRRTLQNGASLDIYKDAGNLERERNALPPFAFAAQAAWAETEKKRRKPLLRITITSLLEREVSQRVSHQDVDHVKRLVTEDPSTLLYSWCVDLSYDGEIFAPTAFFTRKGGHVPLEAEIPVEPGKPLRVVIKATDLTGQTAFREVPV